ncbi:hypothetical protein [uncultured Muribaculum sp.]|uniref:hypothetical protein n=1 Tax=uncultured Muribaculum sp. TaxID=1918613 RepID=UPI00262A72C6|nr:hypothetical protein [uncultured Muribaculum sp.]
MQHRVIISIFCVCVGVATLAQIQATDSLRKDTSTGFNSYAKYDDNKDSVRITLNNTSVDYFGTAAKFYSNITHDTFLCPSISLYRMIPILYTYPPIYPGMIHNAENFSVLGSVVTNDYPGLVMKNSGSLGVSIGNDKLNLYVGGIVNKHGFYGGLLRQLGLNGRFTYQFSSPWSFTAFAYYYGRNTMPMMPDGSPMPPSMLGYYDVSRFGGYINYSPSKRFGIQVGGQVVERISGQNHYEVEPIATPYINVGRGKKKIGIGLPVGQILHGLLGR